MSYILYDVLNLKIYDQCKSWRSLFPKYFIGIFWNKFMYRVQLYKSTEIKNYILFNVINF